MLVAGMPLLEHAPPVQAVAVDKSLVFTTSSSKGALPSYWGVAALCLLLRLQQSTAMAGSRPQHVIVAAIS